MYIADTGNNRIRKIDIATGEVTTLAGSSTSGGANGTGTAAQFDSPRSIAAQGGKLYVADNNASIREINIATRAVTTRNINGISRADSLAITPDGKKLYVLNNRSPGSILEIDMGTKEAITLVGTSSGAIGPKDGIGDKALFNSPESMAISPDGKELVVADDGVNTRAIRSVTIGLKLVLTLAKPGGALAPTSGADSPKVSLAHAQTKIYIADSKENRIKQLSSSGIQNFAGEEGSEESKDGPLQQANFSRPEVIAINRSGTKIFVIDSAISGTGRSATYTHHRVRMIEYK